MEDRGEDSLLAKKAKKKRNVGKSCVAYGCVLLYSYYKYVDASLNKRISRHVTDDFSYQPITGDVSFHATKMFYHSSCFLLLPWLPRRHWAAQPMKLCLVIYKRSLIVTVLYTKEMRTLKFQLTLIDIYSFPCII